MNVSKLRKINNLTGTVTVPNRVLKKAIFKNVAHRFTPGETPSISSSHKAPNCIKRS